MAAIDTIKKILAENLDVDPEAVNADSTPESLDIDSLDMVELICDLEDAEGVDLGEVEEFKTVGEIAAYVDSLK